MLWYSEQLKQMEGGSYSGGLGLNQKQTTEHVKNREKEAANHFGKDVLNFGLKGSSPVQYCVTSDNSTVNPPAKRAKIRFYKMLEKRKANAKTDSTWVKIRQWKIINVIKREYTVSSSLGGKTNYLVTIGNVPSCCCPDFRKRGSKVLCKHIIFVSLYVLQLKDERRLPNTWIGNDDLKSVISSAPTNIPMLFNEPEVQKRTPLEYQRILQSDIRYNNEQSVILHNKQKRLANCRGCKSTLNVGELCLKIECLAVPFNGQNAVVQQLVFCCPKKYTMQMPPWVYLKPVTQFIVNADVEAAEKEKALRDFDLN